MDMKTFRVIQKSYSEDKVLEASYAAACVAMLPKFLKLTEVVEEAYEAAPAMVKYNKKFLEIRKALEDLYE